MDDIYEYSSYRIYWLISDEYANLISNHFWQVSFWSVMCYSLLKALSLSNKFYSTRNALLLSLLCLCLPAIVMATTSQLDIPLPSTYSVICQGVVTSLLTADIIIAKMANRQMHPLIPAFLLFSLLGDNCCLAVAGLYYSSILTELCYCFDTSLFSTHDERTIVFIGE